MDSRIHRMVGATGIEPVTPSMSTRCSPAELRALETLKRCRDGSLYRLRRGQARTPFTSLRGETNCTRTSVRFRLEPESGDYGTRFRLSRQARAPERQPDIRPPASCSLR